MRHRHRRLLRPPGRRQDRHHRQPRGRVVLRATCRSSRRRSGSATRRARSRWRTCTGSPSPAARSRRTIWQPASWRRPSATCRALDLAAAVGTRSSSDRSRRASTARASLPSDHVHDDDGEDEHHEDDDAVDDHREDGHHRRAAAASGRAAAATAAASAGPPATATAQCPVQQCTPAARPRSHGARAHPCPWQGCPALPQSSANSGLVLATERLGSITRRGTSLRAQATRRAALAAGLCALVLTAAAAGLAWAGGSPLVPRHGGHPGGNRAWSSPSSSCCRWPSSPTSSGPGWLRRAPPRVMVVAAIACAIQLAPLAAPLLLSTDAWTYWDYGRIAAVHDANPYAQPPSTSPTIRPTRTWAIAWRNTTSVYGPAFTLASEPLALVAGTVGGRCGLDLQGARPRRDVDAWRSRRGSRGGRRSPGRGRLEPARWRSTSPAAATTTRGRRRSSWPRLRSPARAGAQLAGAGWALAAPRQVGTARRCCRCAWSSRGRSASASGTSGWSRRPPWWRRSRPWRYGLAWTDALRPLEEHAERETAFALPHRLDAARRSAQRVDGPLRRGVRPRLPLARSAGPGKDARASAWRRGSSCSRFRISPPGTSSGRCRSPPRRTTSPRIAARPRALAYLLSQADQGLRRSLATPT